MVQEEMSSVDDRLGEGKGGREAAGVWTVAKGWRCSGRSKETQKSRLISWEDYRGSWRKGEEIPMGPRGRSENGVSDPTWEGEQKEKGTIGRVTLTSERDGRSEYSQLIASVFYWK
jgi:hypothetical protein